MAVNEHGGSRGPDEADERIARLYKEAAREEPPPRLDRIIASAARERPAAASPRTPWWMPWRVPFAFAAVAVVSVSLVTLMVEEDRERVTAVPPSPPIASPPEPAREPAATAANEAQTRTVEPRAEPKTAQSLEEAPARKETRERRSDSAAKLEARGAGERGEAASAVEPSIPAQQAPAAAPPRELARDAVREAPTRMEREPQPFPYAERAAGVPPPAATAPPAAPAAAPPADAAQRPSPGPRARPQAKASAGARGLEAEGALGAARPAPGVARHLAELDKQPVAAWIERVLLLRKQGRMAEADGVLLEFKRRYPEAVLPAGVE